MTEPTHIVSYVADARRSTALYRRILELDPDEEAPGYAVFSLPHGGRLALRSRATVEPRATLPGGTELCFEVDTRDQVLRTREAWAKLGLHIIQEPVETSLGFTFTAADPDGHRLRVVTLP